MKKVIIVLLVLILAAGAGFGYYKYKEYKKYEPLRNDYARIETEDYTAVYFATYPVEHFLEEDYNYYRAIYPIIGKYVIPDLETLYTYFTKVAEKGNEVDTAYLGVRPDVISADDVIELMSQYGDKQYHIIVAYPSLDYWKNLSEEEFPEKLAAYENFINGLMPLYEDLENEWIQDHMRVYFYGATEWLVGNSANYENDFGVNAGISHMISMYTDEEHGYMLTLENYEEELEKFEDLVNAARGGSDTEYLYTETYPDLSKWDVAFFGDSIIAFEETSSIPGAFEGFTKANTYNCARGGSSAFSLPDVVDALISGDLSKIEENTVVYNGLTDYLKNAKKKHKKCFVIDFGMNDYYTGHPVKNENDPMDTGTYAGALRTGIEKLKAAYPEAVIIMMTPNFTSYFANGTEPQSEVGGMLPEYVEAMISIGYEYDIPVYIDYVDLGIDRENWTQYLMDGCHPNETTRYIMASDVAKMMLDFVEQKEK